MSWRSSNLALLTGNVGRPGSGLNPLRGQNNVQGAAHMGCAPDQLTGHAALREARTRFEAAWGARIPAEPGLTLLQMMDAASTGSFKALWAIGYDVLLTNPDTSATERALSALELLIVQDMFLTETAQQLRTRVFAGRFVLRKGRDIHERRTQGPASAPGSASSR